MTTCKGSRADSRVVDFAKVEVGYTETVLEHPTCSCNTGCRRVALWEKRPRIANTDDWVIKVIARVRFSDGCQGPEVEVDWKRGVVLDLLGCYDEVTLEVVELVAGEAPLPVIRYGALSTCCGAGGARGVATRTTAVIAGVQGVESDPIPVPPFAYAFQLVSPNAAIVAGDTIVRVRGSGAASDALVARSLIDGANAFLADRGIFLPGGSESVFVTPSATGNFEVVFFIGV